ncbi:MAG: hypothetical protein R3264_13955, partial [Anaerolineae bacterium]|nr:hypothetical protein [Anaerolineae bacterium]
MALAAIAADKRYLVDPDGKPFFIFGINYAGYFDRAWKMWENDRFDPGLIARDFRKAKNSGFSAVRLFAHSALLNDLRRDNFDKLDQALNLARDHGLLVLFTLNDVHSLNLDLVGRLDAKIVSRYRDNTTLLGYDLENEPVFYSLAAAIYPDIYPAPIQTGQLIDHYGERVSRAEASAMQRERKIPGHLDADKAYYYINALRLFLEYDAAINAYVGAGKGNLIDFMLAGEAEPWHKLIDVFDKTVEAWLHSRIGPIRAVGCEHLLTVGWNWLHFAALPANRLLDFQSYHNYPPLSLAGFRTNTSQLQGLRRAFPKHPVTFGEFGWSNQSSRDPNSSQPRHASLTAHYEVATFAYLRANAFGGGFKWMLNDVSGVANPYEASFGVFEAGDVAKAIGDLTHRLHTHWPGVDQAAYFTLLPENEVGFAYRLNFPQQLTLGGYRYQDQALNWHGLGISHCFIRLNGHELAIDSHGGGQLTIVPWEIIPSWDRGRQTLLYRVFSGKQRTQQATFAAGESVVFDLQPGMAYVIAPGEKIIVTPPDDEPVVEPNPGEHVLLLTDFEHDIESALKYIRRFAPDLTFAVDEVAGRWAYVTVIAGPAVISDLVLDNIRSVGATLVERISGDTP